MPPAIHPIMLAGLLYPQKWVMEANLPFTRTQEAMCDRLGNCRDPRALMTETAQTAGKSPFPEPLSLHQNPLKCRTRAGGWVAPASRREVWAQQPPPARGGMGPDGTGPDGTGRDRTGRDGMGMRRRKPGPWRARTQNRHFKGVFSNFCLHSYARERRSLSFHDAAESTRPKASVRLCWQSLKCEQGGRVSSRTCASSAIWPRVETSQTSRSREDRPLRVTHAKV